MLCQEVREISLRSGKSQEKLRKMKAKKSGYPAVLFCFNHHLISHVLDVRKIDGNLKPDNIH